VPLCVVLAWEVLECDEAVWELFLCAGFLAVVEVLLCAETAGTVSVPAVRAARRRRFIFLLKSNGRIVDCACLVYLLSAGTTPGRKTVMVRSVLPRRRTLNTTFSPGLSLLTAR